ncbi:LOW QUALITY PROTEIN: hypothetical protein CVT26_004038, partial [Gymnopilus dilepis]
WWNSAFFEPTSLKALGLESQLNHASLHCVNPTTMPRISHASLFQCSSSIPTDAMTSQSSIAAFSLTNRSSTFDSHRALEKPSNNGPSNPNRRSLFRIVLITAPSETVRAGRAHNPAGVEATLPGQLALRCPSCPYPGINVPEDWENAMDAHFAFRTLEKIMERQV